MKRLVFSAVATVLAVLGFTQRAGAQTSGMERQALIDLFYYAGGPSWTNNTYWNGAAGTECGWYGVTCNGGGTTVVRLDLHTNNLVGTLPTSLANLTNLQYLSLWDNQLTGSIPTQLGSLINLWHLDLYENQLTGSIPTSLGSLTKLQWLDLGWNQLTGSIPTWLGSLTNLQWLGLESENLTGSFPELGSLTNLQSLYLDGNQLTGSIPTWLGSLTNLVTLWLYNNQLTGSIPTALGNLINLTDLKLQSNRLTGSIPSELGNLTNLQYLGISGNMLSGAVPTSLENLTGLSANSNDLSYNALYSTDATLTTFLNGKQRGGDWQSTQTVAPTGVTAGATTNTSVALSWTPISYTGDTGGYQTYYSTISGGPYMMGGITANKSASSIVVSGLNSGTLYYFVLRTETDPSGYNLNLVISDSSAEIHARTSGNVCTAPSITTQPQSQTIVSGQTATLTVAATGTAPLSYQWHQVSGDGSLWVGTNASSFTTPALTATTSYWVRVSNACGDADSATATITIVTCTPPSIATQPQSTTIVSGQTATLTVAASGTGPFSYQWYMGTSGVGILPVGGNSSSFTTPALTTTTSYWVRVSNSCGHADSATATITVVPPLTITTPPTLPAGTVNVYYSTQLSASGGVSGSPCTLPSITTQPQSQTIQSGQSVMLSVVVTGDTPFTYQWYQGSSGDTSTPVGTDAASFTTPALTSTTSYWVLVSNACGNVGSATATVSINCTAPSITVQPQSQTIASGQTATLSVTATGTASHAYQWYQGASGGNSVPVRTNLASYTTPGLTSTIAVVPPLGITTPSMPSAGGLGGYYPVQVIVNGGVGGNQWHIVRGSTPAGVTMYTTGLVAGTPKTTGTFYFTAQVTDAVGDTAQADFSISIAAPPQSPTLHRGQSATRSVADTADSSLTYQWYQGSSGDTSTPVGTNAASFTTPALTVTTSYWVRVSNSCGHADSSTATVSISGPTALMVVDAANLAGLNGTHWQTDVRIFNPAPDPSTITMWFLPVGQDNSAPTVAGLTLQPKATWSIDNVIDWANKLLGKSYTKAALRITYDNPEYMAPMIVSRTYTQAAGGGTYGQFTPSVGVVPGTTPPTLWVTGVRNNGTSSSTPGFRTNYSIVNLRSDPGGIYPVTISLLDPTGAVQASTLLGIPPYGYFQGSIASLFGAQFANFGPFALRVDVPQGTDLQFYASVVDNQTGAPAMIPAGVPGSSPIYIAAIGHNPGQNGTVWRSDLQLTNVDTAPHAWEVKFIPKGNLPIVLQDVTLPAKNTWRQDDIVSWLYSPLQPPDASGIVRIASADGSNVYPMVASSSYNVTPNGTFGQNNIPLTAAMGISTTTPMQHLLLTGMSSADIARTNLGFINLSEDSGVVLSVIFYDENGHVLNPIDSGTGQPKRYTLALNVGGWLQSQLENFFSVLGTTLPAGNRAISAEVTVLAGGPGLVYATVIDNVTGDPMFIPAELAP